MEEAEQALEQTVSEICALPIHADELTKVKNKAEASIAFEEVELLTRAKGIAYGAIMGNPNYLNEEISNLHAVTPEAMQAAD